MNIIVDAQTKDVKVPSTGTKPPSLIRGHMFHGPIDQSSVYVYGGTTYMGNMSFEMFTWPENSFYALWSYDSGAGDQWGQYSTGTEQTPNHGAAAEAIDQSLGFYLNGQIDWGSGGRITDIFPKTLDSYTPLEGMIVLDLKTGSGKNISTSGLRDGVPRVGGTMEYIASVGDKGILVALGGQIQPSLNSLFANTSSGSLVSEATGTCYLISHCTRLTLKRSTCSTSVLTSRNPKPMAHGIHKTLQDKYRNHV